MKIITDTVMKLIKQSLLLPICDMGVEQHTQKPIHSELFPNSIRGIICGPSNCGKTNVMISLILHENGLKFQNIYLYSKTAYQPKYDYLFNVLKHVPQVKFFIFSNNDDIVNPNDALPKSIFIFDDVACENQTQIRNYFSMGRHKKVDCFYLSQTYSKIPKQLIRDNANLLIIFKQDEHNLRYIYNEHVSTDIQWHKFKELCSKIWNDTYSFLVINKDNHLNNGRYRQNMDTFISFE